MIMDKICLIVLSLLSTAYASNLLKSLGFQTKLQTTMTISFIIYWLGLIAFFASVAIIFYRFVQDEERVKQFQIDSANKSMQLMHSIRTQMITLKYRRILALQELAKTMLTEEKPVSSTSKSIHSGKSKLKKSKEKSKYTKIHKG
uniref:Uncharacterized protein n=1 Tax=Brugia malayi TaxID=6279 RepID=A0A7I4KC80_BRUMA